MLLVASQGAIALVISTLHLPPASRLFKEEMCMGENTPWGAKQRPFPTEKGFRQTNSQACQSESISIRAVPAMVASLGATCWQAIAGKEIIHARMHTRSSTLHLEEVHELSSSIRRLSCSKQLYSWLLTARLLL